MTDNKENVMSVQIKPFKFDLAFPNERTPPQPAPAVDPAIEIAQLRKELENARAAAEVRIEAARIAGFEAGLAEGRDEAGGALLSAVDALQASMEDVDEQIDERLRALTHEATVAALAAAELVAGHELSRAPDQAIDHALARVLDQVARGTAITVRVHPSLVDRMQTRLAMRQAGDRRRLNVLIVAEDALAPGDAELTWADGGVTLNRQARLDAMVEELRPLLQDPTPEECAITIHVD